MIKPSRAAMAREGFCFARPVSSIPQESSNKKSHTFF